MLAKPVALMCGLLLAAMVAVAPSRAQPKNSPFESQLRGSKYEENDPERLRQLVVYSGSLFQARDFAGARVALMAALAIQTAHGARELAGT